MTAAGGKAKPGLVSRFRRDSRGTVAMIAGFAAIPLLFAAGVAVDMARAAHEQQAFQAALDAAALALGASDKSQITGLTQKQKAQRYDELKVLARKYINKNYQPKFNDDTQISIDIDIPQNGTIKLSGTHDFPTTIMRLAGIDEMAVVAAATVEKQKIPNPAVEIALVMDTTASMSMPSSKIADAKNAAMDLLDIIYDGAATSPYIKVALVPFAQTVNVGADKLNSGWIDKNGLAPYSKLNFTATDWHNMRAWGNVGTGGLASGKQWTGCVEGREGAYDSDDTTPTTAVPATLFTPWFAPDEPIPSPNPSPKLSPMPNPYYTDLAGASTSYANNWVTTEADEVSGLSSTDKRKAMLRQKNQAKYSGESPNLNNDVGPNFGCKGTSQIIPLTNVKKTIADAVGNLTTGGFTHVNVGASWGWKVLSPNAPYTEGAAYDDPGWKKIMIIMTDGTNTYPPYTGDSYNNDTYKTLNKSAYSYYGYVAQQRLGTGVDTVSKAITQLNNRLTTTCTKAKAAGIEVWTVAFDVDDSTITNLLRGCATDTEKYLNAPNGASLRQHFQAIGENILESSLYLSK